MHLFKKDKPADTTRDEPVDSDLPAYSASGAGPSDNGTQYASITPVNSDRLRLLNCPPATHAAIEATLQQYWPAGIQKQGPSDGNHGHEYKLSGRPCTLFTC